MASDKLDPIALANKALGLIDTVLADNLFEDAFSRLVAAPAMNCPCYEDQVVQVGHTRTSRYPRIHYENDTTPHHHIFGYVRLGWDNNCPYVRFEHNFDFDGMAATELSMCWSCLKRLVSVEDDLGLCGECVAQFIGDVPTVSDVGELEQRSVEVIAGPARVWFGREGRHCLEIPAGYYFPTHLNGTVREVEYL